MASSVARLLTVARGGGSFAAPSAPFSLATTGFWNDVAAPRAVYYNGRTFLAWVRDDGHVLAAHYDHASRTLSTPVDLATTVSPDGVIHNSPAVLVRDSDKRIIVAASEDSASAQPAYWISTNPEDASAFGSANLIAPSLVSPTYPSLVQLDNGNIYYFIRRFNSGNSTFYTGYYKSTDDGSSWASFVDLIKPDATNAQYHTITTDGTRIDIFTTDTNRTSGNPSSIYHLYLDSSDVAHQSDGTTIGATRPFVASSGTLVKDDSDGPARAVGTSYGTNGPAAVILVDQTTDTDAYAASWTGSAWNVESVASSGGEIGGNQFIAAAAMSSPDQIYLPVKVGSFFELRRYTNDGSSWTSAVVTTGSASDNAMPQVPFNAAPGLRLLWGRGTYTDDTNFDFTMYGLT